MITVSGMSSEWRSEFKYMVGGIEEYRNIEDEKRDNTSKEHNTDVL